MNKMTHRIFAIVIQMNGGQGRVRIFRAHHLDGNA